MKLPKLRSRNTYTPFILSAGWFHGAIIGVFFGMMIGAAKWDNKPQDLWAMLFMVVLVFLMAWTEYLHKRRVAKLTKMVDEATYMNTLHDGGIDVGSPGFDLVTIDREYRQ